MKVFFGSIIVVLIIILILLIVIGLIIKSYVNKGKSFLYKYFGTTNVKEAFEKTKLEEENTPKSIAGMESICVPKIEKDFPELNINELKRIAEKDIIKYLNSIENKQYSKDNSLVSDKVIESINSYINDLKDKNVHFDSIKVHKTVLASYTCLNGISTIIFNSSVEYLYGMDGEHNKKIQDRFKTEYIYIVDSSKVSDNVKSLGLNCPNCGAPIKSLGHKTCDFCGSGVVDIVKKSWILNNISRY